MSYENKSSVPPTHEKTETDADAEVQTSFTLQFENFVDLQTRLVLLPYNDSECTGAVIHSFMHPVVKVDDEKTNVCGNANADSNKNEKGDNDSSKNSSDGEICEIAPQIAAEKETEVDSPPTSSTDDTQYGDNGKNKKESCTSEENSHCNASTEEENEINTESHGKIEDSTSSSDRAVSNKGCVSQDQAEDGENANECLEKETESNANVEEEDSVSPTGPRMEDQDCNDEPNAKDDLQNNNNDGRVLSNGGTVTSKEGKESPENEHSSRREKDISSGEMEKSTQSRADRGVEDPCNISGNNLCVPNEDCRSNEISQTSFEGAVLIEITGDKENYFNCRDQEFTSILNSIRDLPSPIILKFEHLQDEKGEDCQAGGVGIEVEEEVEETSTPTNENCTEVVNGSSSKNGAAAIKGRFQRWGNQFAGEAATRARKAAELAKEKVHEIQQLQKENNAPTKRHSEDVEPVKVEKEEKVTKKELKNEKSNICGLFLQTSSGKCVPLNEDLYGSIRRQNQNIDSSSKTDHKRGRNLFRKNPPKLTNTSVLVIKTSAEVACPRLGYQYQWYRSCSSCGVNDEEGDYNDAWLKLEGATSYVFQPSATDVGCRIKCEVMIEKRPQEDEINPQSSLCYAICESPIEVESDKVLFDAAIKTFRPMKKEDARVCVSSFDNLVCIDTVENLKIRIDLHTYRSLEEEGRRSFFMKVFGFSKESLHKDDERINDVLVGKYSDKATVVRLQYYSIDKEANKEIKLKAPSRIARETFLLALGIASFDGKHSDLNVQSPLFSTSRFIGMGEAESIAIEENSVKESETDEEFDESGTVTPPLEFPLSSTNSSETPVNSKMIAIESELENDLNEMKSRLESKDKDVSDLKDKLRLLQNNHELQQKEHAETRKKLKISQRRIESLESDLVRIKEDQAKHCAKYEKRIHEHEDSVSEYKKLIKSLGNEKAVLSAAVEARDSKLLKMEALKKEFQNMKQEFDENRNLRSQIDDLSSKNNAFADKITELETHDNDLKNDISALKRRLADTTTNLKKEKISSSTAKLELEKKVSQMQNMKSERNRWKQKADSLSKEMSRICRGGKGIGDIERLIRDHQKLGKEVTTLKSQKKRAENELEESLVTHATYVQAQEKLKVDGAAIRAVQKCVELERLVSHLTEYVHAKEMQLESIQAVNRSLTDELHLIHQKQMKDNDV